MAPAPGFEVGDDGLAGDCFLFRQSDLVPEVGAGAPTRALDAITEVEARKGACGVRNPTGRSCLGSIRRDQERLERALVRG